MLQEQKNQWQAVGNGDCSNCGNGLIHDHVSGIVVCDTCGMIDRQIMVAPSYRISLNSIDMPDPTQYVSLGERPHILDGLGSFIGYSQDVDLRKVKRNLKDAYGKQIPIHNIPLFLRFKLTHERRTKISDEALYRTLKKMNHVCAVLNISHEIRDDAAKILRKSKQTRIDQFPAKRINHIILGCISLMAALRRAQSPITDAEVIEIFIPDRSLKILNKAKNWMQNVMPDISFYEEAGFIKWIPTIISSLENSPVVEERMIYKKIDDMLTRDDIINWLRTTTYKVAELVTPFDYQGKAPKILAASLIYSILSFVLPKLFSQKLLADIVEVAEYSIRDHYRMWKKLFQKADFKAALWSDNLYLKATRQ